MKSRNDVFKITLTGVPNVGKSTLFNTLTGMNVHTGNWSGKTVETSVGRFYFGGREVELCDLPGTYSLTPNSEEERLAAEALMLSDSDVTVIVCDESRLFSNMNFILQVAQCRKRCILCLNFFEAAKKEGKQLDISKLSSALGMDIVRVNAKKRKTLDALLDRAIHISHFPKKRILVPLSCEIEKSVAEIEKIADKFNTLPTYTRGLALHALSGEGRAAREFCSFVGAKDAEVKQLLSVIERESGRLFDLGITSECVMEAEANAICAHAEEIYRSVARCSGNSIRLGFADRILTGRVLAYPAMLLLFGVVLFITVKLASYPSIALEYVLGSLNSIIRGFFEDVGLPQWAVGIICDGGLGTLFTVVAVMLPPMALFFPFFTLLEDSGYLPRVAYNLDRPFAACGTCGKQALTMCMGLGCNSVGVTGARIIESRRERLLAILTNSFVPCNGRFPMLIVIISAFFVGTGGGFLGTAVLLGFVIFSFCVTLGVTFILSRTLLRGERSLFIMEFPPYRKPDFLHVLVRSLYDRTLKILGRAAAVAFPAGIAVWCLSNVEVFGQSIIFYVVSFLDPLGRFIGLDGIMLTAFILGIPANETVLPIALSLYGAAAGTAQTLIANGWTWVSALCASLFTLFHWPCATTIITIKKETNSVLWTLLAVLLPTVVGIVFCAAVSFVGKLII